MAPEQGGGHEQQLKERLRQEVMASVEAVLAEKAESLWKRGAAEVAALQQEREHAVASVRELRARQEQLQEEQASMREALVGLTASFESVVSELRQVIRMLPRPDPAGAAAAPRPGAAAGGPAGAPPPCRPPPGLGAAAAPPEAEGDTDGPRTPRRASGPRGGADAAGGSPALRISLASALQPAALTPPPRAQRPKRLQIAERLAAECPGAAACGAGDAGAPAGGAEAPLQTLRAEAPAFVPGPSGP